jgi:hypothetical protein
MTKIEKNQGFDREKNDQKAKNEKRKTKSGKRKAESGKRESAKLGVGSWRMEESQVRAGEE